ncbi:deoxyribodipyrimidine photolyase [Kiloniella spongiae]|uniref:Deoxyribodipyrimidine photo-lyase n=1 Tax=Kiloniella spongiae TaxID=1489064 RepID=A0A0H2MYM4_9PROT|nr:deoxyribodipyrimidine photo-lyase [Kiloniella spongiae]KLN61835.1 deoxyribodipyrimidine photolyase [Kiloniella spongiae]
MPEKVSILWFRQDLRLEDNPALCAAVQSGRFYPVYILDDESAGPWEMGNASRVWLNGSLEKLDRSLEGKLSLYRGNAEKILPELAARLGADCVYWNRCYEPWRIKRDTSIKQTLTDTNIDVKSFNGSLLWEPWEVLKKDSAPYKVFTPYYRACRASTLPAKPVPVPKNITALKDDKSLSLQGLSLLPREKVWVERVCANWAMGEKVAHIALEVFIENGLARYKKGRDYPSEKSVSRLSPHLHFGEVSPNFVLDLILKQDNSENRDHFCSELAWREFSYYLLYHFPKLSDENFQSKFDGFSWFGSEKELKAWQQGMTGVPIVDAGMRELWQTGYMHNRVRMIVASFLTKNLGVHWREGAKWFWDTLVDADLASNSASWQWVAGSGADAAPYFRIFNPVTQSKRFDEGADYICTYVPELAKLPARYIFAPWEASVEVLHSAGIELGRDYPKVITCLKSSREKALLTYKGLG